MPLVPLVAFVPQRSEREAGLPEFALQSGIGDGGEHHALRVRQNHGKSRTGDLLVETFHFRSRDRKQFPHSLLQFLERLELSTVFCRGAEGSMRYSRRHRYQERVTCGSMPAGCKPFWTT